MNIKVDVPYKLLKAKPISSQVFLLALSGLFFLTGCDGELQFLRHAPGSEELELNLITERVGLLASGQL